MAGNNQIKILLVDDEPDIQEFISYNLIKESYKVYTANNGIEAIETAKKVKPALIILDVMMPKMNGFETCNKIRAIKGLENIIIVFLSARGEDIAQITGYDAGADDYITKPIKPHILVKKVKSLLRRLNTNETNVNLPKIKSFKIIPDNYAVIINNRKIIFPKKEFKLLHLLASNPDKAFTRKEIYDTVWGDEVIVGDRTIDVHIREIRKKIGSKYITTFKGIGYKFENI